MKTIKSTIILFSIALFIISCGKDSSSIDFCNASSYDDEIPAIVENFSAALQSYGTNPTDENCKQLTVAYGNYLNFFREYQDCPFTFNNQEVTELIREGEMDIAELPCN